MEQAFVYRPRRKTRQEDEDEHGGQAAKRQRTFNRVVDDRNLAPSSALRHAAQGGYGYRDFVHGKSITTQSRTKLDAATAARVRETHPPRLEPAPGQRVPSLSAICIHVVVENYDTKEVLDKFDQRHSLLVPPIVNGVLARTGERQLPFRLWSTLASHFYLDLPNSRKTYRGLALEDKNEIAWLDSINKQSVDEWCDEQLHPTGPAPSPPPCFFLAAVDLKGHTQFGDGEMYRLTEGLASFLVILRLDGTSVSDGGMASIVRNLGQEENYERLEVLSLRALRRVTDRTAKCVAKLPSLRMIDIRGTSCTDQFRLIANAALPLTTPRLPWRKASKRPDLPEEQHEIEFALFGPSLSLSNILTQLRSLTPGPNTPKAVLVHIDTLSRGPAPVSTEGRTAEELYRDQLHLRRDQLNANRTFSPAYGSVSSTVRISKGTMDLDAAEADKGAAFRMQDDSIAAGAWLGARTGSMYDVGRRKVALTQSDDEDEPLSDRGEEGEDEAAKQWATKKAARDARSVFYSGEAPADRPERKVLLAGPSPLILVRHLPLRPPYERPDLPITEDEDLKPVLDRHALDEGAMLTVKKRARPNPPIAAEAPPKPRAGPPNRGPTIAKTSSTLAAFSSPLPNSSYPFPTRSASTSSSHETSSSGAASKPTNPFKKNPFSKKTVQPPLAARPPAPLPLPSRVAAAAPVRRKLGLAPIKSSSQRVGPKT